VLRSAGDGEVGLLAGGGCARRGKRQRSDVVVIDSEDEIAAAIAPAPGPAPAAAPPVSLVIGYLSSPEQEAVHTPRPTTRLPPARTRARRGWTRRNASPRFTSPPDDMFLSDSPPQNQLSVTATRTAPVDAQPLALVDPFDDMFDSDSSNDMATCTAPVDAQPPALVDPFNDIFDSDSSDELPLSLFSRAPVASPTVNSVVDFGNEPVLSQNTFGTPSSTRATCGLSSQPSHLLSPTRDNTHTPLHFHGTPSSSRTPQGFSPSGPAYPTGTIQQCHLNDHEFEFFIEQALSAHPPR